MAGKIRIGISGWRYPPWRGKFYPKGLRQAGELTHAADKLSSIEINGTFYSLQRPEYFARWRDATPDDFVFAVKGPQLITHVKRLKDAQTPLADFFASGLLALKHKLGPILWQLPPSFVFDPERLSAFFDLLPRTTHQAAKLAQEHDPCLTGRAYLEADAERPLRHAMEIRHNSFCDPAYIKLLRHYQIALVVADAVEWPRLMDVTADFVYVRLHGSEKLYASGYGPEALAEWAARLSAWAHGQQAQDTHIGAPAATCNRDVYVYFDNTIKVRAPFDALSLMALTGQSQRSTQPTLF